MSVAQKTLLTPEEYLARERAADFRSEFFRGEMFAMVGTSWEQNLIKANLARHTGNQLENGPCHVVTSDLRVKISATGLYTYPDIVIVCDEPRLEDRLGDTLLNPHVIVEVLSKSTESYDRGRSSAIIGSCRRCGSTCWLRRTARWWSGSFGSSTTLGC